MIKQLEMTGKNKEDAIARGLEKLGMDRDDVSVEILELGKTGFLGIGSVPAKVRLTYEVPDEAPPAPPAPPEEPAHPREQRPAAPAKQAAEAPAERPAREAKRPAARDSRPAPAPAKPPRAPKPAPVEEEAPPEPPAGEDASGRIVEFLTGLLAHMDVQAAPEVRRDGDTYDVVLQGENLGAIIGRRGETLDAIQQLTGYAVNRGRSKRVRIHVDAENYRARREESLRRLANKVAGKVVRYHRSVTLEPMNAYERHVIHTALQDYRGVSTHSIGVEPNRRTVVSYDPQK